MNSYLVRLNSLETLQWSVNPRSYCIMVAIIIWDKKTWSWGHAWSFFILGWGRGGAVYYSQDYSYCSLKVYFLGASNQNILVPAVFM